MPRDKDIQVVVVTGWYGCGRDANVGSGGGTDRGGGGGGRDKDGDVFNWGRTT